MRSLSRRETLGVLTLLGLLGLIGFYELFLPRYRQYLRWDREIRDNLDRIRRAQRRLRRLPALRKRLRELGSRAVPGRSGPTPPGVFPRLLRRLEALGARAHIPPGKIARIQRSSGGVPDVSGAGARGAVGAVARYRSVTMENVVRLIWRLRGGPTPIGVHGVRLDPVVSGSKTLYDVRLRLRMPLAPDAAKAGEPGP